jgi:hypothetical protein
MNNTSNCQKILLEMVYEGRECLCNVLRFKTCGIKIVLYLQFVRELFSLIHIKLIYIFIKQTSFNNL